MIIVQYGLTQADYDRMVAMQDGLCTICERRPRAKLCVDHCHATLRLRFLLCNNCNTGFGYFEENPRLLRRPPTMPSSGERCSWRPLPSGWSLTQNLASVPAAIGGRRLSRVALPAPARFARHARPARARPRSLSHCPPPSRDKRDTHASLAEDAVPLSHSLVAIRGTPASPGEEPVPLSHSLVATRGTPASPAEDVGVHP
jgi:hypothetical protein